MQMTQTSEKAYEPFIRSALIIPTQSVLLNRPEEIAKIDEKFKGQNGIKSVVLIGPGGAGKTILARQYAHAQKASVIWEINAETNESINYSFESLARSLAKTDEGQKILKGIQEIKDLSEKEDKLLEFIRDHLKSAIPWCLIYDNVEEFGEVQKYFPQDVETWGQGKIILTTRDNSLESSKYVNSSIKIQELALDEKLALFRKILANEEASLFSTTSIEKTKLFLGEIPPYPLDVSMAAYYLKMVGIPYNVYLTNLAKNKEEFVNIQERFLKEVGDYTKTRYGILTLSLQHLMRVDKKFGNLLLLMSLLSSQNIPRAIMDRFEDNLVVDNFIYHLKKYSLITGESFLPSLGYSVSLHRSTQAISLEYLTKLLNIEETKG